LRPSQSPGRSRCRSTATRRRTHKSSSTSATPTLTTRRRNRGNRGQKSLVDIRPILKSQYHASLAMLREAIELCPDDVWYDRSQVNAFWQIAYHTLFFAELYLGANPEAYRGWPGHQANCQNPDGI